MIANWFSPIGIILWVLLFLNGIFSAASGPILQALPFQLPEIGLKYAASAGGVIGSVSLIISYVLPIGIGMIARKRRRRARRRRGASRTPKTVRKRQSHVHTRTPLPVWHLPA